MPLQVVQSSNRLTAISLLHTTESWQEEVSGAWATSHTMPEGTALRRDAGMPGSTQGIQAKQASVQNLAGGWAAMTEGDAIQVNACLRCVAYDLGSTTHLQPNTASVKSSRRSYLQAAATTSPCAQAQTGVLSLGGSLAATRLLGQSAHQRPGTKKIRLSHTPHRWSSPGIGRLRDRAPPPMPLQTANTETELRVGGQLTSSRQANEERSQHSTAADTGRLAGTKQAAALDPSTANHAAGQRKP